MINYRLKSPKTCCKNSTICILHAKLLREKRYILNCAPEMLKIFIIRLHIRGKRENWKQTIRRWKYKYNFLYNIVRKILQILNVHFRKYNLNISLQPFAFRKHNRRIYRSSVTSVCWGRKFWITYFNRNRYVHNKLRYPIIVLKISIKISM